MLLQQRCSHLGLLNEWYSYFPLLVSSKFELVHQGALSHFGEPTDASIQCFDVGAIAQRCGWNAGDLANSAWAFQPSWKVLAANRELLQLLIIGFPEFGPKGNPIVGWDKPALTELDELKPRHVDPTQPFNGRNVGIRQVQVSQKRQPLLGDLKVHDFGFIVVLHIFEAELGCEAECERKLLRRWGSADVLSRIHQHLHIALLSLI